MQRCASILVLTLPLAAWAQPADPGALSAAEKLLKAQGVVSDGAGLLRFFRARTLSKQQQDRLSSTVQQLGDPSFAVRERAAEDLVRAGMLAKPFLLDVLKNPSTNLELMRRAELCLRQLAENRDGALVEAAALLLARHKPDGAAAVLLDYLPFATDDEIIEKLQDSLNQLALSAGQPDDAVLVALKDTHWIRRGAAAEALIRASGLAHKKKLGPLLEDATPRVRLQVAVALVEKHDRDAVPALIEVLDALPADELWLAEDLLHRLAGADGPDVYLGPDQPAAKVQQIWRDWWTKNADSADLTKLSESPRLLGFTLITQMGNAQQGKVLELKPNKTVNWEITSLRYPVDAQFLGPNRVLIVEYLGRQVTERNLKGDILWRKPVDLPIGCQRLPNGHTFIATRRQILIVDKDGNEVFVHQHRNTSLAAATRTRDGQFVLVTSAGMLQRLDQRGKEIKSFKVGALYALGSNIDVLPNGHILVPQYRDNTVAEYDAEGKVVWQTQAPLPTSAVRLPDGHTLITSMAQQRVFEVNRQGAVVWEYRTESRPWRARRR